MTDIDTIAQELAVIAEGTTISHAEIASRIKSALAAYGDECAKQMRNESEAIAREKGWSGIARSIRALPLPSEKVKP